MSKFTVEIQLENAQMRRPADVCFALTNICKTLDDIAGASASTLVYVDPDDDETLAGDDTRHGTIRDLNGNTVGRWRVED